MKRIIFFLTVSLTISNISNAQISSNGGNYDVFLTQRDKEVSAEFKSIANKMYLTTAYMPAKVDNINETFYLRYNIHKDQMEFTRGGKLFFLKKDIGRIVNFTNLGTQYAIYKYSGKDRFFVVHNEGKHRLLTRLVIKYQESQPAQSSYQQDIPADFKRQKDEHYIAFNNKTIVRVPSKKKSFYKVFGEKASDIKEYMKSNKLSYKKVKDIAKAVEYFNTL